ncbi:MAG: class IV adenylate cyclase [Methanobacteriaceae archaeon]|nr:class IV adenylate cyclase [Methanobacteriaceae archaeon]
MIEVEVKAKANPIIKKKLEFIGAQKIRTEKQEDIYFNAPHKDFKVTDEALRIRKTPTKTLLTYKGPKIDEKSKTRQEIETEIPNPQKMTKILECLGFKKAYKVVKEREIYQLDDFTVTIDNVKGLGTYIEIEKDIKENEDYDETLQKIFKIYKKLGIRKGFQRKSYLELLLE